MYVSYTRYADVLSGVIVTAPSLSEVAVSYWSYSLNSWVKRDISVGIGGWYNYDDYNYDKTYQAETDDASLRCDPFGYSDYGGYYSLYHWCFLSRFSFSVTYYGNWTRRIDS